MCHQRVLIHNCNATLAHIPPSKDKQSAPMLHPASSLMACNRLPSPPVSLDNSRTRPARNPAWTQIPDTSQKQRVRPTRIHAKPGAISRILGRTRVSSPIQDTILLQGQHHRPNAPMGRTHPNPGRLLALSLSRGTTSTWTAPRGLLPVRPDSSSQQPGPQDARPPHRDKLLAQTDRQHPPALKGSTNQGAKPTASRHLLGTT